jgi:hypothetical protein
MGQALLKGQKAEKPPPPSARVQDDQKVDCNPINSSKSPKDDSQEEKSPNITPKEVCPPIEVLFAEEEIAQFLAPHPIEIEPSQSNIFNESESRISIVLMPHKHTLFCERKVLLPTCRSAHLPFPLTW